MINKLSACLVVKNDEKVIRRCLNSLKNVVDEIIVVHDGECTDDSLNIAKEYNAKIFIIDFTGEIDLNKIYSIQKASYDWILQIDADEFLSKSIRNEIPKLIKDQTIDAYAFRWPAYNGNKYIKGPFENMSKTVLLRKDKLYQIGITDEPLRTYGKLKTRLDLLLEHKPLYNTYTLEYFKTKWLNYADQTAKRIVNLEDVTNYNIPNKDENSTIQMYKKLRANPSIYITRYILANFIKMTFKGIFFSPTENWKILYLIYMKRFNTYKRIKYYKYLKSEKSI